MASLDDFFSSLWLQPYMWTICFFCWYQLYCSTFLGLINCSWYTLVLLFIPFVVIWLLSVTSLYRCLYTRPPLIPHIYLVPQRILNLLNNPDDLSCESSGMSDCESSAEQSQRTQQSRQTQQKRTQWELFYRQVTELVEYRNLNVRTSSMTFGKETIQCPNVCTRCYVVKPDRVHHCRRCGRCVVRMDHHCPAIGKCVHLGNHKFFLIFLVYATLLCIYAFFSMTPLLVNAFIRFYTLHPPKEGNHHDAFSIPFAFSVMGCLQSLVFPVILTWFQWSLWTDLFNNRTTLEEMEEDDQLPGSVNKYDIGSRLKNVESVFGEQKWRWFLPLHTTKITI